MSRLLRYAITAQQWRHHLAFQAAAEQPAEAQARVLRALLKANASTAFGREHDVMALIADAQRVGGDVSNGAAVRDIGVFPAEISIAVYGLADSGGSTPGFRHSEHDP